MNSYLYLTDSKNAFILISKFPKSYSDARLIATKAGKLHPIHYNRLKQFKISNGSYMMSENLLMSLARAFDKEYEDLWNEVWLF